MKCPKCGYLGFEAVERCRNCGYDFSLSQPVALPDLAMRNDSTAVNPLDDFLLSDPAVRADRERFLSEVDSDVDRLLGVPSAPEPPRRKSPPAPSTPSAIAQPGEPSLFGPPIADDIPLITRPSPPRTPLAVRRATPELPRLRNESSRAPSFDLPLDLDSPDDEVPARPAPRRQPSFAPAEHVEPDVEEAAGMLSRLLAVAIDVIILAIVDVVVVYFTMQICGIGLDDFGALPKGPLIAFLLVQNGGYLVAFTAGGQTLGKMAAGIKVIAEDADAPLDVGRALVRTVLWLVLAVPAGLGFLSAIFNSDHRGLHDRFARTRVVRASA
jgi:uncharacterized RDD family membrane protein YckC